MLISNPWKPAMPKAHNINKVDYIITISTLQNDFDKLVSHKKKKKKNCTIHVHVCISSSIIITSATQISRTKLIAFKITCQSNSPPLL